MAGLDDYIPSFFLANAKPGEPLSYAALQTRRKIAEQLMGKRSPFPKTFGEGLTYLGEGIGDAMQMNRLDAAEKQQAAHESKFLREIMPGAENTAVAPTQQTAALPTAGAGAAAPTSGPSPDPTEAQTIANRGYNFMDAAADAGGYGPRFRTERNAEVASRVGVAKAIQGINPEMQARMMAAYNAMPDDVKKDFVYNEGSRPRAYQQYLYDTRSGRGLVAPPGSSRHETGEAVDVDRSPALDWLKANGAQFGLAGIPGDYPHVQMARGGRQFLDPTNPATLPIPGQSTVPAMPPGSRDAMTATLANQSPAGSMVNTPAPLSGGTATPDMLAPGGFTQPAGPVRTAALTTPGVASDAGPAASAVGAVAALPTQQSPPASAPPLIPGGPPTPTDIKPMPTQVAQGPVPPTPAALPSQEAVPPASPPYETKIPEFKPRPEPLLPSQDEVRLTALKNYAVRFFGPDSQAAAQAQLNLNNATERRKEKERQQQEDWGKDETERRALIAKKEQRAYEAPGKDLDDRYKRGQIENQNATNPFAAAKAQADMANAQLDSVIKAQQVRAGKPRETKEINGITYEWDESKNNWALPVLPPGGVPQMTEKQTNTIKFLQNAYFANQHLGRNDEILKGFWQNNLGNTPVVGNFFRSPQYRSSLALQNVWAESVLRDKSGALIGVDEMAKELKKYFPEPFDDPQVIELKAQLRDSAEKNLASSLGHAKPVYDNFLNDREERRVPYEDRGTHFKQGQKYTNKKGDVKVYLNGFLEDVPHGR